MHFSVACVECQIMTTMKIVWSNTILTSALHVRIDWIAKSIAVFFFSRATQNFCTIIKLHCLWKLKQFYRLK